jgi:hypothetical protein
VAAKEIVDFGEGRRFDERVLVDVRWVVALDDAARRAPGDGTNELLGLRADEDEADGRAVQCGGAQLSVFM